jgi:hypothetical protein
VREDERERRWWWWWEGEGKVLDKMTKGKGHMPAISFVNSISKAIMLFI